MTAATYDCTACDRPDDCEAFGCGRTGLLLALRGGYLPYSGEVAFVEKTPAGTILSLNGTPVLCNAAGASRILEQ